jgi:Protein of unknown function (DUF2510)
MSANPPAGWYPDPHGQAELRYWDGATWTEHTSGDPAAGAAATDYGQQQAEPAPAAQAQAQGPIGFQQQGPGAAGYGQSSGGGPKPALIAGAALLGVAAIVGLLFLTGVLGGGDEGNSEEDAIRTAVEDVLDNPDDPDICENLSDDLLDNLPNGRDDCESAVEGNSEQDYEIQDITVDGDAGSVELTLDGEDDEIDMVKDGGDWKVDDNIDGVCCLGAIATTTDTSTLDTGTGTDTESTGGDPEAEVREVVDRWLEAVRNEDAQEFCNTTSIKFARDRGVRGNDDKVIEDCVTEAPRMINELIIAPSPDIDTIDVPGGSDFQTADVTLTDTSVLTVIGTPGEFWFVDTFK